MECPAATLGTMTSKHDKDETESGRQVGLGRVVEEQLSIGSPDPDDPGGGDERAVRNGSEESFPASDPPTWMSDPATGKQEPRDESER